MHDLITILVVERRTLLRGLLVAFLVTFPLSFLPLMKDGFTWPNILQRFPASTAYALGFSLVVVIVAVIVNYNKLVANKIFFDKPAFSALGFQGRLDGKGSISKELETFLLGKIGDFFFRINLVDTSMGKLKVEIVPLVNLEQNQELFLRMKKDLGFRLNRFFGITMVLTEKDWNNPEFLSDRLYQLVMVLQSFGAEPMEMDERVLMEI